MKIKTASLSVEPLRVQGVLQPTILGLDEPAAHAKDPIVIDLSLSLVDDLVVGRGSVETAVELQCGRCCRWLRWPIRLPDFHVRVRPPLPLWIDLTPFVREDILLALPMIAVCDEQSAEGCFTEGIRAQSETGVQQSIHGKDVWGILERFQRNR
ncbi:MAG: metal-binding protein [Methylacidiphilaceae bacterium]|nr:metal-binding protein [Candidatus Methylacidiphilaceae bacterium]